jgi:hypothetical protein
VTLEALATLAIHKCGDSGQGRQFGQIFTEIDFILLHSQATELQLVA